MTEDSLFRFMLITMLVMAIMIPAFFLVDVGCTRSTPFKGVVLDKHHKAESHSAGTGVGITSNGDAAVVMTSSSESEEFLLIVEKANGEIVTVKCESELYYDKEIRESINCAAHKGLFTGYVWHNEGIK